MHIAFTGGGTGGHIYPCLAIAELINYENKFTDSTLKAMYYIGNTGKLEEDLVQRFDYIQFLGIEAPKMPRKNSTWAELIKWLGIFHKAYRRSVKYIKQNKIDVVMGTGGYVAAPVFCACLATNTKFLIHNLDSNFGLVNKIFRRFASKVTLGFPMKLALNKKYKYTGNPVSHSFVRVYDELDPRNLFKKNKPKEKMFMGELERSNFAENLQKKADRLKLIDEHCLRVIISGGSKGSQFINDCVGYLLKHFTELNDRIEVFGKRIKITHITGNNLYKEHVDYYLDGDAKKYKNYKVMPYSHDMADLCKDADVAICRAGAMTCSEMVMVQCIPIFFPLPWAANNHQMRNAVALSNYDCAFVIKQDQENTQKRYLDLFDLIILLAKDTDLLVAMKKKLRRFAKPLASKEILGLLKFMSDSEAAAEETAND